MNENLQKEIYQIDPIFTRQKDLDWTKTLMCEGFCYGDGWFEITKKLVLFTKRINEQLQKYNLCVVCHQAKEKFGWLTIYFSIQKRDEDKQSVESMKDIYYNIIRQKIHELQDESQLTCQICGTKENITKTKGWIRIVCQNCKKELEKKTKW